MTPALLGGLLLVGLEGPAKRRQAVALVDRVEQALQRSSQVLATLKVWEDPIYCRERLGLDRVDVVHVHDPDDHLDEAALTRAAQAWRL